MDLVRPRSDLVGVGWAEVCLMSYVLSWSDRCLTEVELGQAEVGLGIGRTCSEVGLEVRL